MSTIVAPAVLQDGTLTGPCAVVHSDGRIVDVRPVAGDVVSGPDVTVLPDGILSAGMVDLQVNGFHGVDLVAAEPTDWVQVRRRLAHTGVTSFLGTFITAPLVELAAALERLRTAQQVTLADGARLLGAHLEGPFLSARRHGAHNPELMVDPTDDRLDVLLCGPGAPALSLVTLAPERDHAIAAIRRLAASGVVVSIGHTDSTASQVSAAADAGASMVTHLFNAQRRLGHREPGVPGQAIVDDRLTLGLIVDLHHVAAPIVDLVFRAAPGRVALVTDAIAAAGMSPGRYDLGGVSTIVAEGDVPRRADGTIAGSSLTLDAAVRNAVTSGAAPEAAIDAATRVPACLLGRQDVGVLAAGAHADLVWWSPELTTRQIWLGGRPLS